MGGVSCFRTPAQIRRRWIAICDGKRPIWEEDFGQLRRLLSATVGATPPERIEALAGYMRRAAKSASKASRIMAQAKSPPERTVEWEVADILDAIVAAARQGGDVKQAPAESPQSGAVRQSPVISKGYSTTKGWGG
jgi:hypothetical protein